MKTVDISSIAFHMERDDFERWIREVIGDVILADKLAEVKRDGVSGEDLRRQIVRVVRNRIRQLDALAAKVA